MKLMYHRQALDYIAEHRFTLLLREDMEICASYLGSQPVLFPCPLAGVSYRSKYISPAMKTVVLMEMTVICNSQDNVDTMPDILSSHNLDFLLESRNEEVQGSTCRLLGSLARECPNRTATWAASVCKQLASLLQRVLSLHLSWTVGIPKHCHRSANVQHGAGCLEVNVCEQLVFLLRDESLLVIERATYALYYIPKLPEGMQAALEANLREHVPELPESLSRSVQEWICAILAAHNGMLATLVGGMHCK
ncbi:hypothetical protein DFH09DRAFT_1097019 [Mycena vulgaris]|nr:hypothetical protein DFH09DRAFT_1097019 [Mycena vulgaris]